METNNLTNVFLFPFLSKSNENISLGENKKKSENEDGQY